jgi:hypothetical protein
MSKTPESQSETSSSKMTSPISIESAVNYITDFHLLPAINSDYYGGYISRPTIESISNNFTSEIKAHFCWDADNSKMFLAFETADASESDTNIYDEVNSDTLYVSQNYFPQYMGSPNVLNLIPLLKNSIPPLDSAVHFSLFYNASPLANNTEARVSKTDVNRFKADFKLKFHNGDSGKFSSAVIIISDLNDIINQNSIDVIGIRYYFGYDLANTKNEYRFVLVGVDQNGNDILNYNRDITGATLDFVAGNAAEKSRP